MTLFIAGRSQQFIVRESILPERWGQETECYKHWLPWHGNDGGSVRSCFCHWRHLLSSGRSYPRVQFERRIFAFVELLQASTITYQIVCWCYLVFIRSSLEVRPVLMC